MKKIISGIFILLFSALAFSKGYKITYKVYVSGSDKPFTEEITLCDNWLIISIDKDRYYLFQNKKGYLVNKKKKTAVEYDLIRNMPFFSAFIAPYGITTNDGTIIFPQLIFKKTKKTAKINKLLCRKYELPGNYLNSKSIAWFSEKKLRYDGKVFAKYLSFFTTSRSLIEQAKRLNSLPVKLETFLEGGLVKDANIRVLDKIREINCVKDRISLPKDYKIIKAKPQGIPAAAM